MCGIAGFLQSPRTDLLEAAGQGRAMAAAIRHRGPDAGDVWVADGACAVLAHRRLSILDLSDAGAQPMHSHCGRYVLAYNGELYNVAEIRRELEASQGIAWRGHSDTEVLLEALARWGTIRTLQRANGMFAFALWDTHARSCTLARDRMGEKPLYYGQVDGRVVFASELGSILALARPPLDEAAVAAYFRFGHVPAPLSILRGIRKLPPASFVELDGASLSQPQAYWSVAGCIERGAAARHADRSEDDVLDELDALLDDAVAIRMLSDVPLGAFLSAGIDSSLIAATMARHSSAPLRTFTIGFDVAAYDEAPLARAFADRIGADHHERYVTEADALEQVQLLPRVWDEPFADSSQLPALLLSRFAREHVTVALSGDAGDELFAGYDRYHWGAGVWRSAGVLPGPLRRFAGRALAALPATALDRAFGSLAAIAPPLRRYHRVGERLHKLAGVLGAADAADAYQRMIGHWPELPLRSPFSTPSPAFTPGMDWIERAMAADLTAYLPDDILVKVDRAAMAYSLETRIPLLDPRIIEFAWSLPGSFRLRRGQRKWPLAAALRRRVPGFDPTRPKSGFAVPIGDWLRGALRPWAEELLEPASLRDVPGLDPAPIRRLWQRHLSGAAHAHHELWIVLMLQAWRREWQL